VSTALVLDWVRRVLWVYEMLIFAYALMSWFQGLGGGALVIYRLLGRVCEPFVGLIRRVLPAQISGGSGVDLSPLIAMLLLIVAQQLL
jgi:YggT family protein